MKNNKGFISVTVIYAFFLVFLTLMLYIVTNMAVNRNFLNNMKNPLKDEYYIQSVVNLMMHDYNEKVKVFDTNEKWYGVTYKEDKQMVVDAMKKLFKEGYYDGI